MISSSKTTNFEAFIGFDVGQETITAHDMR